MQRLQYKDINEAAEVIVSSFEEDPVWKVSFPNLLQRRCVVYSIAAGELFSRSLSAARVIKDEETGKILCVCIFEQERYNFLISIFLQLLGGIMQSYYYFFVKLAKEVFGTVNPLTFVLAVVYSLVTFLFLIVSFNTIIFALNFGRSIIAGNKFMKSKGWSTKKTKHLLMFGTMPEAQGKGLGSQLMTEFISELEKEGYYEGFHLESSNPRNVSFYERNQFENVGEAIVRGQIVTFMVRPAADSS